MKFEFIIAYQSLPSVNIAQVLIGLLSDSLEDNLNEFENEDVANMIHPHHERILDRPYDGHGVQAGPVLLCFSLDLADEVAQLETVIEHFSARLCETPPIFHAVKFNDPLLHSTLMRRAEEIFALEMKLRRVLTLIYLHANGAIEPYDLLKEETVQPMVKDRPPESQMRAVLENQFFHLTFGQYVNLNRRAELKQVSALLEVLRDSVTYDVFRSEVNRLPVEHEDDAILLAGLKERMDAIELMRNCVAHNRNPSRKIVENYENAQPLLDQLLDNYLARWESGPFDAAVFAPEAFASAASTALVDVIAADVEALDDSTATSEQDESPKGVSNDQSNNDKQS
jgi:hypothetical protein